MIAPVVDTTWLAAHRDEVVVADVRWYLDGRLGRAAYDAGHLPGAVFVDVDTVLAGPPSPDAGRHPLPAPATFAAGLADVGIGDGSTVVAYDDAGGVVAARLVWLLRVTGRSAALLDGGLDAYAGPLEQEEPPAAPAVFTATDWPEDRFAGLDEVVATADADRRDVVLLDARDAARYRGDHEPVDPRAGHIPGARNVPAREHIGADGRLLSPGALRERFAAVGVGPLDDVIASCGSGVTACHTLLMLEHASLGAGRLFPGSWSQYSADPARPAQTGGGPS